MRKRRLRLMVVRRKTAPIIIVPSMREADLRLAGLTEKRAGKNSRAKRVSDITPQAIKLDNE